MTVGMSRLARQMLSARNLPLGDRLETSPLGDRLRSRSFLTGTGESEGSVKLGPSSLEPQYRAWPRPLGPARAQAGSLITRSSTLAAKPVLSDMSRKLTQSA